MSTKPLHFDTLQIHAGYDPEATTHASQVPIYQTTLPLFLIVLNTLPIYLV